ALLPEKIRKREVKRRSRRSSSSSSGSKPLSRSTKNANGVKAMMKKTRPAEDSVADSSGNVFANLGIKDADVYLAKSVLAIRIQRVIKKRHLTQDEAGQILGIS